jgi:hypothetical protein
VKQVIIGLDLLEDELANNVDGVAPSIDEERKDHQVPIILRHAPQKFRLEAFIFQDNPKRSPRLHSLVNHSRIGNR